MPALPTVREHYDSDRSSIISISDKALASDSDSGPDMLGDTQKYRLPEVAKTRGSRPMDLALPDRSRDDDDAPPLPPPKDSPDLPDPSPPAHAGAVAGDEFSPVDSYFNPYDRSRAGSIYSLSRVSFTNQISQLTSIPLPQASTLSNSISAIPTSTAAARTLNDAAEQIRRWMHKASDVLDGLDAEDDVEWAAAGGRDGLEEVDKALNRFESLIEVYVVAIEELQQRKDVASLPPQDLKRLVGRMEEILKEWGRIKSTLKGVKGQVEIAMEWEELWSTVLGEISLELEALTRLVFEMEERRHRMVSSDLLNDNGAGLDLSELKTIVEEAPRSPSKNNRHSQAAQSPTMAPPVEDSNLLALFARMQPLRASLDFLPMRLSVFFTRAKPAFPSACDELERRRVTLEGTWKKLQDDAEALRKEFSEDQWIDIFRKAATKAHKMWESVTRSLKKLGEALESGEDGQALRRKIASYKDKKTYYHPAIESVMTIIDTGIRDRLTVNGEIVRLQSDLRSKLSSLQEETKDMDDALLQEFGVDITKELPFDRIRESSRSRSSSMVVDRGDYTQQLRDSVSTVITDHSLGGSAIDTPGSSPASSIIMSRKSSEQGGPATPYGQSSRPNSFTGSAKAKTNSLQSRRFSGRSPNASTTPRKTSGLSDSSATPTARPSSRLTTSTPTPSRFGYRAPSSAGHRTTSSAGHRAPSSAESQSNKPRWNASVHMRDTFVGHHYTPDPSRSTSTPRSLRSVSSHSSIPVPSPLGPNSRSRQTSMEPSATTNSPTSSTYAPSSRLQSPQTPAQKRGLRTQASMGNISSGASPSSNPRSTGRKAYDHVPSSGYGRTSGQSSGRTSAAGSRRASAMLEPEASPSATAAKRAMAAGATRSASAMSGLVSGRKSSLARPQKGVGGGTAETSGAKGKGTQDRPHWR